TARLIIWNGCFSSIRRLSFKVIIFRRLAIETKQLQSLIFTIIKNNTMKNIVLIINIALVLLSCGGKNEEKKVETVKQLPENNLILTDEQYKNAGIEIGKLTTQIISPVLKLNGKIEVPPQGMVTVSIPMGGYLKSTR